ncbi:MAG: hypothetical protein IT214_14315 [Chitinophagaceae bacterium]|nr:hypothetical protein [Chitinophagaceae bacterium]OQY93242.1 MAG: hypothetical protein B6D37_12325 [Sphingobacteriales bacterium UTBCD1]
MKHKILLILSGFILFYSCKKESINRTVKEESCSIQTDNPGLRSYPADSLKTVYYTGKNCGLLPLNTKNYWIYLDSFFTDGVFQKAQYDTLRFEKTFQSIPDGLIWWQANMEVGLPEFLYSSDSGIFSIQERYFSPTPVWDARKEFSLFSGETVSYLTHFDDNAALGKSVKLEDALNTPAGQFPDCIQFEKNARTFRKDEIFFKPGVGVIKYSQEKAPPGSPVIKLQKISTLVKFHIE